MEHADQVLHLAEVIKAHRAGEIIEINMGNDRWIPCAFGLDLNFEGSPLDYRIAKEKETNTYIHIPEQYIEVPNGSVLDTYSRFDNPRSFRVYYSIGDTFYYRKGYASIITKEV